MAFQIKDFTSITASSINWAKAAQKRVTDFSVGSVIRTLIEAVAVEIEELYQQYFIGLREAIPVSTFLSFGFDRLPAAVAIGVVSIAQEGVRTSDLLIPAGTLFKTADGREYTSLQNVTWLTGTTFVRISVSATLPGSFYNIGEGLITSSPFLSEGNLTISNQEINSGRDAETVAEREARFTEFVASLSRGTNTAIRYITEQSMIISPEGWVEEYITRIGLGEVPGRTTVHLYSSLGIPSSQLILLCQRAIDGYRDDDTGIIIPGYRPSGVRVDVVAMIERTVPMAISVEMLSGYTLSAAIIQSINNVYGAAVAAILPDETLYLGELSELILAIEGIKQVVINVNENIICDNDEVLVPGTLTITLIT